MVKPRKSREEADDDLHSGGNTTCWRVQCGLVLCGLLPTDGRNEADAACRLQSVWYWRLHWLRVAYCCGRRGHLPSVSGLVTVPSV